MVDLVWNLMKMTIQTPFRGGTGARNCLDKVMDLVVEPSHHLCTNLL